MKIASFYRMSPFAASVLLSHDAAAAVVMIGVLCNDMPYLKRKDRIMELQTCSLACVGDSALPFVILGAIVIALIMLVVSFVLMKRRK